MLSGVSNTKIEEGRGSGQRGKTRRLSDQRKVVGHVVLTSYMLRKPDKQAYGKSCIRTWARTRGPRACLSVI
jgi:hypothetical protein